MPGDFDAYYLWLSIPPQEQPPDHYRLLGVPRFEDHGEVITHAADQRMGYLRTLQTGPHSAHSQRLLNEVARAKLTLLDPRRKKAYDAMLRSAAPADAEEGGPPPAAAAGSPASPSAPALATGQIFGRFRLAECLRQSVQATVFRAEHLQTGHSYSLKVLSPAAASDATLRRRFQREIDLCTQLQHPHLIAGHEGGELRGCAYLVSEYVVASDLHTLVTQCGALPVYQAVEYLDQAARGLGALHAMKVYHRNVSPRNLLVDLQGQIKITNLFLARIEEGSGLNRGELDLTRMGDTMGTVEYLAPEQAMDASSVDQRADIYSLGCTLHFLLTGGPVYAGRNLVEKMLAHRKQPIPSLRAVCREAPEWLDAVFHKMLAKNPAARFQSMAEVCQALGSSHGESFAARLRRLFGWFRPRKRRS